MRVGEGERRCSCLLAKRVWAVDVRRYRRSSSLTLFINIYRYKKIAASHQFNMGCWGAYAIVTLFVYFTFSGGDFSFIMTAASLGRLFGLSLLNIKMFGLGSAEGISLKSIQLYAVVFFFRLTSILRHDGYLPYDKSGDWVYHAVEFCSFGMTLLAWYGCQVKLKGSYQSSLDRFGAHPPHVPSEFGTVFLLAPMFLLALLIKPNLNSDFLSDFAWVFAMYVGERVSHSNTRWDNNVACSHCSASQ